MRRNRLLCIELGTPARPDILVSVPDSDKAVHDYFTFLQESCFVEDFHNSFFTFVQGGILYLLPASAGKIAGKADLPHGLGQFIHIVAKDA